MIFNSLTFAVFLPIVLSLYYRLRHRGQNILLLFASYVFYGWWDPRFLILLFISTVVDYFAAKRIGNTDSERIRRAALAMSLCANLGILGFFKYFNFFTDSAIQLLASLDLTISRPILDIVLPVGISFYTFQTLSYTIDVYRGKLTPCRDFATFALYVSFFPQLVAGPIERAERLLPQLEQPRRIAFSAVQEGLLLMLLGYFKKVGIADALAPTVDVVFASPDRMSGYTLLIGLYFFSIQIYCDFSGYSDIARGVARLLGVDLMVNFNQPYFSASITEFWRRWHISLSSWLKDYLYIPLGGNRKGRRRTYINLMLTMLLGGLWHGANWTFVIWGGLHGVYLAIHKWFRRSQRIAISNTNSSLTSRAVTACKIIVTFHLVVLSWAFFRSPTFTSAIGYVAGVLTWQDGKDWIGEFEILMAGIPVLLLAAIEVGQYRTRSHVFLLQWSWAVRGGLYAMIAILVLVSGGIDGGVPFIYFQF